MRRFIVIILVAVLCFALEITGPRLQEQCTPICDDYVPREFIPYSGGSRQSPGVQIGMTYYDLQRQGSFGQRLVVDDSGQIHVNWMYCGGEYPGNPRFIKWNFRFADGFWYGDTQATPSVSGYCQLDIMIADSGLAKRTMNAWHYSGYSWINIDEGSGWGSWPGDTGSPHVADHIWPAACVANNNNIVMATGNSGPTQHLHHFYLTTDEGQTWTHLADFDSCTSLSHFVRASRNPGSQKVVHAWTQSIAMDYPGTLISQMANDIWYVLSTDNGVTWGRQINVTKFTPPGQMVNGDSTLWAFADVNAVFDEDDNLHFAFCSPLGYMLNDTLYYGERSKICHWDEVSDTITVISSPSIYYYEPGGWWLDISAGFRQHTESWRLQADQPQLVLDSVDNTLFCLWHGQDDTTDYSADGWFNGELYGSYSTDNGLTWSDYVNLTNTRSPGAENGDCFDEDYMTAWPYVVNDSIFITYIEDKAAATALNEGTGFFENPVRVWVFHKGIILGTEEYETQRPEYTMPVLEVYPNPFSKLTTVSFGNALSAESIELQIYDVSGRIVKDFSRSLPFALGSMHIMWDGTDDLGYLLPAGVYFVRLETGEAVISHKIVKLK